MQITTKQKIAISSLAVVLSLAAFVLWIPVTITNDGLEQQFTTEELTKKTQVIVIGEIVDSRSDLTFKDNDIKKPFIWTTTYIKPERFIKGSDDSPLLEVKTIGGQVNNIKHDADEPKFQKGDRVLLFLNKEPDSVYGNSYYVSGVTQGKWTLKNSMADNENPERNLSETALMAEINKGLGK